MAPRRSEPGDRSSAVFNILAPSGGVQDYTVVRVEMHLSPVRGSWQFSLSSQLSSTMKERVKTPERLPLMAL